MAGRTRCLWTPQTESYTLQRLRQVVRANPMCRAAYLGAGVRAQQQLQAGCEPHALPNLDEGMLDRAFACSRRTARSLSRCRVRGARAEQRGNGRRERPRPEPRLQLRLAERIELRSDLG